MFLWNSLTSYLWNNDKDKSNCSLIEIGGSFYQLVNINANVTLYPNSKPSTFKPQWKCLFNTSTATIQRNMAANGTDQCLLIINRIWGEGEKEIQNEREEDSHVFVIGTAGSMNFTRELGPCDHPALSWTNANSNSNTSARFLFEYDELSDIADGTTGSRAPNIVQLFERCLSEVLYQQTFQRTSQLATEEDLVRMISIHPSTATNNTIGSSSSSSSASRSLPNINESEQIHNRTSSATPFPEFGNEITEQEIKLGKIIEISAKLFLFEESTNQFQYQSDVIASISTKKDPFKFSLVILKSNESQKKSKSEILFAQEISNEMYMHFNAEHLSCIWVYVLGNLAWTWSLVFPSSIEDRKFKDCFTKSLWETNTKKSFSEVKTEDVDWIVNAFEDKVQMEDDDGMTESDMLDFIDPEEEKKMDEISRSRANNIEDEQEELIDSGNELGNDSYSEDDSGNESDQDKERGNKISVQIDKSKSKSNEANSHSNSLLAVAYKNDNSYVVRGSKIGVFKNTPQKLKYKTTINSLKDSKGNPFSPKKMMLHRGDNELLFLHPTDQNKVLKMDLNRSDIVSEWNTTMPVNELVPQQKYAQMTDQQTLIGVNSLGLMQLDPRQKAADIITKGTFYSSRSKPQLSCAATTGEGHIAIGSQIGEIRMYTNTQLQKPSDAPRAKTNLPGCGDPIKSIDVTEDGLWILATCKTYLLVIPTQCKGNYTGFQKSMGQEKPVPRRLQLKREHILKIGGKVEFTPAKFNIGSDKERSIVTSTSNYVVTWNFRKVKQNILDQYQLKKYDEVVVADHFRYGDDKSIIVTTPNDVTLAKKVVKSLSISNFSPSSPSSNK